MKIAVLGNSHVGMLRAASAMQDFSGCQFAWMARHTPETWNFIVQGTEIVDQTKRRTNAPGLETRIDLAEFDAVVFAGNTVRVHDVVRICRSHVVPSWIGLERARSELRGRWGKRPKRDPLSEAALDATLCGRIRANPTYIWAAALRESLNIPMLVVPPPYIRERVRSPDAEAFPIYREVREPSAFPRMAQSFNAAHLSVFDEISSVSVLLQDAETVTGGYFTKETYAAGALSLDPSKPYASDDMTHGNAEYGRITLNRILHKLCGVGEK